MARTFKSLLGDDVVNTRTLLHEAIPITGTIVSGTYFSENIKTFSHGMFQSVYDYPFLSSSANHIFDITYGHSSIASASANTQNAKKLNVYNQMAQVLMGYDVSGSVRKFDSDGTLTTSDTDSGLMNQCFFINFSRLLVKDEIKKGSFRLQMFLSGVFSSEANWGTGQDRGGATSGDVVDGVTTIGDYLSTTEYRTSPAGDYGLLFTGSAPASTDTPSAHATASIGLVFYQAGVVVLTSSVIQGDFGDPDDGGLHHGPDAHADSGDTGIKLHAIHFAQSGSNINQLANGLRHLIHDIDFNNTIELNSSIYFCRVNHNEFNYSSNPTYVSGSKLVVKNNITDLPLSYITTVGLYSPDNELMAVAKLSEPIRKDPNTELTLRVRLDY
tara:strand:- start:361 stop:1515 length:1155 start_codon:yes stop_codon:yes gene_type:complete